MARGRTPDSVAPVLRSASMPADPSAFMTTMIQSPWAPASPVTVRGPVPVSDATQKVCPAGLPAGPAPGRDMEVTLSGANSISDTSSWPTPTPHGRRTETSQRHGQTSSPDSRSAPRRWPQETDRRPPATGSYSSSCP
jgi:hypothetical protein